MKWLRKNLAVLLTAAAMLTTVAVSYGRLDARQESLSLQVQDKIDRGQVIREFDQVHQELQKIDQRLDGVIIRTAIVADQ